MNSYQEIFAAINSAMGFTLISIDGPAGAGKTTLAETLKSDLRLEKKSAEIIHMDDLYNGWEDALGTKLGLALGDIASQTSGKEIIHPIYNWAEEKYSRIRSIPTPDVLILDGVGSGHSVIREKVDISIWVEIEPHLGIKRAIDRDGKIIAPYMDGWEKGQAAYFAEHHTRESATFTIVMD